MRLFFHELSSLGGTSFLWKSIWKGLLVSFFVSTAALGKILFLENLRKRRVIVMEWCCMCKRSGEFIDHLLCHSAMASELWSTTFSPFGVEWVMSRRMVELLDCWRD